MKAEMFWKADVEWDAEVPIGRWE